MAFEEVMLRTSDGQEYGPATREQLLQWHREGRVPPNASIVDLSTRETTAVSAFLPPAIPPPPAMNSAAFPQTATPSGTDHLIPVKNPKALIAYYCGVFSILCAPILGPTALVLGIMGLRDAKIKLVGRTHALVGIIAGGVMTLLAIALIIFSFISYALPSRL